jgi:hypothetical protein
VPIPDPEVERTRKRLKLKGELSSPLDSAARLRFMPSKSEVLNNAQKSDYRPRLIDHGDNHFVAEHDPIETLLVNE